MLMVQSKPTAVKSAKLKPPPPVPPRPSQNVVAEALAKTRKAVAESKTRKPDAKAKTLERSIAPQTSPKLNGLARVKSFIRDVISDRSSTEERKSANNARRGSTDSVQLRGAPEPRAGRTIKSCRQALVRSLSTSTKSELENKRLKSSGSFAEKVIPLRRAPPPPLSPKPKLREVRSQSTSKRNSAEIVHKPRPPRTTPVNTSEAPPKTPTNTPPITVSVPVQTPVLAPAQEPVTEAPYVTVEDVTGTDDRLSQPETTNPASEVAKREEVDTCSTPPRDRATSLERKTSRVTERLISEIIASRNKKDANSVIDKGKADDDEDVELVESESKFCDMSNHEKLIFELQTMRSQSREGEEHSVTASPDTSVPTTPEYILDADPLATDDSQDPLTSRLRAQFVAISSMSLAGLPPLPKSLSGFAEGPPARLDDSPPARYPPSGPDQQLAYLKKEMASLRRLDLSLLSELWALNESIAAWRLQLERAPAPRLRPAPPPPPPHHYVHT